MTQHPNTTIERSRSMCSIVQRLLSSDQLKSEVTKLCQADKEIYAIAGELGLELRLDLNVPVDGDRRATGARVELAEFPDQLRIEYQALWKTPKEAVNVSLQSSPKSSP